jgi:hypothetical protein
MGEEYLPTGEQHPDKMYFWVDEDGIRCSPRHRTLKAALNYVRYSETWVTDEGGRRKQIDRDREKLPSQKNPVKLRVGEWAVRDLSPEEQSKVDQVRQLLEEGLV